MEVPSHTDSNPPDSHSHRPTYWGVPITGIPTESGTRKRYFPSPFVLNIILEFLVNKTKGISAQIHKDIIKFFADDIVVYVENLEEVTKDLLEVSDYSKVVGFRVNMHMSFVFCILTMNR